MISTADGPLQRVLLLVIAALTGPAAAAEPPSEQGYEARCQWLLEQFRDHDIRENTKPGLPDALARLELADGQAPDALEYISRGIPGDASMFDYPPVARALYMFGEHFSDEQLQRLRTNLSSNAGGLLGHGTENHAAMRVASGYLFAQYFPDATWDLGGKQLTSEELMAEAKWRILRRGRGFYRVGNNEQLSTTYGLINAYPFLTLMEYAEDPEVRDAAEALVLFHLATTALNSFDGHIMPPFNRRNEIQQRFGPPERRSGRYMPVHHPSSWLFWGQNEVIPEDFTAAAEPAYPLFFALSDWRIPEPLNRIAKGAEAPYEIRGALGWFGYSGEGGHWGDSYDPDTLRYVWRDEDYAIGGAVAQRVHPEGFFLDFHMFGITWKSDDRFRSLEVQHPYWRSNEGQEHWKGTHSPFQQAGVHRNTALVMFDIPQEDPWRGRAGQDHWLESRDEHYDQLIELAQVRFPKSVDQVVRDGDTYFFREGEVYVAARVLQPGSTLDQSSLKDFYVINSRAAQTGFVFEVGTAEDHGNFQQFQETVQANELEVDWNELEVRYRNSAGDELRFRYDTGMTEHPEEGDSQYLWLAPRLWINGKQRDTTDWPVADSPVVSLRDQVLRVEQGGDSFRVDWQDELPRIEYR